MENSERYSGYKLEVLRKLYQRNENERKRYEDIVHLTNNLYESIDLHQKENRRLIVINANLENEIIDLQNNELGSSKSGEKTVGEKRHSVLQDELAELHKQKGEYAQQVISLRAALDEKEREIAAKYSESTTPAEDRYIVLSAKRNRRTTAQQVANQFLAASGKQISRKTVARRLRGGGIYARRPVVCVPLTRQHRTARLQWCREHHNWTEQDWACVLFSDESRFSLSSDCRRQLIWRESGTAYRPENIQEKDRYPTCSIMVWGGIMINGRTRLHVVANGTMTGQRYIDEVLLPHVRLFRGAVGDKFVFMDDNATCHRTLAVQDCLDSDGIQRLVWPARSPDLNPVENVWDALGRQVAGRNYPPTNKNTFIRALTEEWDKLPQQLLDNVVESTVRRVECCITFHGGHIPIEELKKALDASEGLVKELQLKFLDTEQQRQFLKDEYGALLITFSSMEEKKQKLEKENQDLITRLIQLKAEDADRMNAESELFQRHLAEGHLGSRHLLRVLPLTRTHRRVCLKWCHTRGNWTAAEWNQVIFSDKSRFNLSSDDNRVRAWRPHGECHNPAFALQRHTAPVIWCDGMGCHYLQYTIATSIDPWHHDSPAVCS
ncbi:transposable element Tcb2 transposase [Trichonephila clavipes]|uniref:Transposable element Tcb2 transposase n=1 Tax=Trichonephila clavipes TaxID=2585209 RepID=A0A8X6REF8_TRICX|nr:transposable element Tcb2 transposase [Trichonephila clavipes]